MSIYNDTLGTVLVNREFYVVKGRDIIIDESYFATLPKTGVYQFTIKGKATTFTVQVNVTALPEITLQDLQLQEGCNAVIYIGRKTVEYVKVNGKEISEELYQIKNGTLTIASSAFELGDNDVELAEDLFLTVSVERLGGVKPSSKKSSGCGSAIGGAGLTFVAMAAAMIIRRGKKDGNDD